MLSWKCAELPHYRLTVQVQSRRANSRVETENLFTCKGDYKGRIARSQVKAGINIHAKRQRVSRKNYEADQKARVRLHIAETCGRMSSV